MAAEKAQGNVAVSPLSLGDALALVDHAAKGQTAEQLDQLLGLPVHKDAKAAVHTLQRARGDQVRMSSALWVPSGLPLQPHFTVQPFTATLDRLPDAATEAADRINAWAHQTTDGAITHLVDPTLDTHGFVITSAAYFKGAWKARFDPKDTHDADFHGRNEAPHPVPMMHHKDIRAMYWSAGDLEAVRLPLQGGLLDYLIITSKSRAGADEILQGMSADMEDICRGIGFEWRRGEVALPRHTVEHEIDLASSLKTLGLQRPFEPTADFSRLSSTSLRMAAVQHHVLLKVDEEGAEAAAATAVTTTRSMEMTPVLHFLVDRPFIGILVNSDEPAWPLMLVLVRGL